MFHNKIKRLLSFLAGAAGLVSVLLFLNGSQTTYGYDPETGFYEKWQKGGRISYLVIGDSIGRGSGAADEDKWFSVLERKAKNAAGADLRGNYIVQSGATAFEGIYKWQQADLKPADLIFIVFGENDRKYMKASEFALHYETLIREVKDRYPRAEIVNIIESCLKEAEFAAVIQKLSVHYDTILADMRPVFRQSGLTDEQLTADGIHPNKEGYRLYADALFTALNNHRELPVQTASPLYQHQRFVFREVNVRLTEAGFASAGPFLESSKKGDYAEYRFTGTMLGAAILRFPEGGIVSITIDGVPAADISTWWPFPKERYVYIAGGLEQGEHIVRFTNTGRLSPHQEGDLPFFKIKGVFSDVPVSANGQ